MLLNTSNTVQYNFNVFKVLDFAIFKVIQKNSGGRYAGTYLCRGYSTPRAGSSLSLGAYRFEIFDPVFKSI